MALPACTAEVRLAYSPLMSASAMEALPLRVGGDEELMLAYAAGDASAFDRLYERHKGGVYRYLLRHCGNAGTAEELFQDIWMSLIHARRSYAPTARFTTWLYRLAQHRLIDHWRVSGRLKLLADMPGADDADDDPIARMPAPVGDEPEVRVGAQQLRRHLTAALAALPPAQRDAFLLQQEAGLALAEIAEVTGVGVETVKSRLRYAVSALRLRLGHVHCDYS